MAIRRKLFTAAKNRIPVLLLALSGSIVVFFQSRRFVPLIDYTYQAENAYRLFRGEMPYGDFFLVLTPGTFYVMSFVMWINQGYSHHTQVILAAASAALFVLLTYGVLQRIYNNKVLNFFLTLSAVFSGFANYPFPLYNNDSVILMLLALYLILGLTKGRPTIWRYFVAGIAVILPTLFKQNTGLIFLVLVSLGLIIFEVSQNKFKKFKLLLAYLAGIFLILTLFVSWLFYNHASADFVYQVFTYPAAAREPIEMLVRILHSFYEKRFLLILLPWVAGILINKFFRNKYIYKESIFIFLFFISILVIPYVYLGGNHLAFNWLNFVYNYAPEAIWYPIIFLCAYIAVINLKKDRSLTNLLILSCVGAIFSAFLSWGVASGISIWPFLLILVAYLSKNLSELKPKVNWTVIFSSMFIFLAYILAVNAYLLPVKAGFVASEQNIQKATLPRLQGLATRGNHISIMENMFKYTDKLIPKSEPVVLISGEDPFYVVTGRINPLDFSQVGVNTYPDQLVIGDIKSSSAKWLIVKNALQLNSNRLKLYVDTGEIAKELEDTYKLYDVIPGYDIYVRR